MNLTFLLEELFSKRTFGAFEIDANATALDQAIKNGGNDTEIILNGVRSKLNSSSAFI